MNPNNNIINQLGKIAAVAGPICVVYWFLIAIPTQKAIEQIQSSLISVEGDVKSLASSFNIQHFDITSRVSKVEEKQHNDEININSYKQALDKNTDAIYALTLQLTKLQEERLKGGK